jgi:hypothetical protein
MMLELRMVKELEDESEGRGTYFLGTIDIGGAGHHFSLLEVVDEDGVQKAADPLMQDEYDDYQRFYSTKPRGYETIEIPALPGRRYVAWLHPRES